MLSTFTLCAFLLGGAQALPTTGKCGQSILIALNTRTNRYPAQAPPHLASVLLSLTVSIIKLHLRRYLGTNSSVMLAGVNIAGYDMGCTTDGACPAESVIPPVLGVAGSSVDG